MSKERAEKIKLILFDVDGVMTDGTIFLFPAPAAAPRATADHVASRADDGGYSIHSETVVEAKGFNAHDGTGISLARLGGLKTGIITKRISETVALRARDLKLNHVYQGQADKTIALDEICEKEGIQPQQIAYVGDDVIDLPVMRRCGLAIAVANALEQVKAESHVVTKRKGGEGAAREAIEYILQAQGTLKKSIDQYIATRPAVQKSVNKK